MEPSARAILSVRPDGGKNEEIRIETAEVKIEWYGGEEVETSTGKIRLPGKKQIGNSLKLVFEADSKPQRVRVTDLSNNSPIQVSNTKIAANKPDRIEFDFCNHKFVISPPSTSAENVSQNPQPETGSSNPKSVQPVSAANQNPSAAANDRTQQTPKATAPASPAAEVTPQEAVPVHQLPNGMVGTEYRVDIPELPEGDRIGAIRPEIPDALGISVTENGGSIVVSGVPGQSGEFVLPVRYDVAGRPCRCLNLKLLINPDPRSLWKNIAPPDHLPYQKLEKDSSRLITAQSIMVAASCRGRSHAHEGTFRDDDFRLEHQDGWHFIGVSDGAGSAKYSRQGSNIACDTASDEVFRRIHELEDLLTGQPEQGIEDATKPAIGKALYNILGTAGKAVYQKICSEAASDRAPDGAVVNDYAATLIFSVYKKFQFGWFIAAFAVGDGGIAVYDESNEVRILNKPDGGEYAGQTRFVTMPHIWDTEAEISSRIQVSVVRDFTAIIAMTDGVSDPKFGTDNNFFTTSEWTKLWQDITAEVDLNDSECQEALVKWLEFWSPGNHDDRTIAIGILTND